MNDTAADPVKILTWARETFRRAEDALRHHRHLTDPNSWGYNARVYYAAANNLQHLTEAYPVAWEELHGAPYGGRTIRQIAVDRLNLELRERRDGYNNLGRYQSAENVIEECSE
jgi:hypothetical protein